ncbi:hypothetical protein Lal_00023508 [Lupinus albus]|nr:hypothetical protein Lal_00023508 [Lupinus albus]
MELFDLPLFGKSFSDHCLVLLRSDDQDWGQKPFRANNCWLSDTNLPFGAEEWKKLEINSRVDAEKSTKEISEEDVKLTRLSTTDLWCISRQKDNLLMAKSRQHRFREGDSNSKFFHAYIKGMRRFKEVTDLLINGNWVEDPIRVKENFRSFFHAKFAKNQWDMPTLYGIEFKKIYVEQNNLLTTIFEEIEIKEAIWSCEAEGLGGIMRSAVSKNIFKGLIIGLWDLQVTTDKDDTISSLRELRNDVLN